MRVKTVETRQRPRWCVCVYVRGLCLGSNTFHFMSLLLLCLSNTNYSYLSLVRAVVRTLHVRVIMSVCVGRTKGILCSTLLFLCTPLCFIMALKYTQTKGENIIRSAD